MKVGLDATVQQNATIMHTDLGEEVVMMDVEAGAYFGLDAVGARVWAMTAEPVVLADVVSQLLEEFDVEREQCETALATFVADLIENGMLNVVEG